MDAPNGVRVRAPAGSGAALSQMDIVLHSSAGPVSSATDGAPAGAAARPPRLPHGRLMVVGEEAS